jgi:hypothetical protein
MKAGPASLLLWTCNLVFMRNPKRQRVIPIAGSLSCGKLAGGLPQSLSARDVTASSRFEVIPNEKRKSIRRRNKRPRQRSTEYQKPYDDTCAQGRRCKESPSVHSWPDTGTGS